MTSGGARWRARLRPRLTDGRGTKAGTARTEAIAPRAGFSRLISVTCILAVIVAVDGVAAEEPRATLTVVATNFRSDQGRALVKLANAADDYDAAEKGFRLTDAAIEGKRATIVFTELPYGEYAVKIFQDENRNSKLDIGLMGPKESYGFSNNVMGTFGPPAWEKAKFSVAQPELTIQIETK